ncbi:hypothetical protein KDH_39840 [Dictyobacter sp. S3.2.2.5]|uniref:Uncharacterized protein n=1 Tax=Dictyobacter halimunensis TaxID=3026934 RepID=A0ABQ6FU27_9CHLR|nr:hypothetical protein KDH_39840 [Dictyobacter sp. S3.2.2.5]
MFPSQKKQVFYSSVLLAILFIAMVLLEYVELVNWIKAVVVSTLVFLLIALVTRLIHKFTNSRIKRTNKDTSQETPQSPSGQ